MNWLLRVEYVYREKKTVGSFKDPGSEVNELQCLREMTSHKVAQEKSLILTLLT